MAKHLQLTLLILIQWWMTTSVQALDPGKPFDQYVFNSWSIEQGLPQISVHTLTQDDQGYIWIGTQAGLARFDGVKFKTFSADNTPGIPGNFIQHLLTDSKGRLWVGTYKGLTVYYQGGFTNIPVAADSTELQLNVQKITEDHRGDIWIATTDGLYQLKHGKLFPYKDISQPVYSVLAHGDQLFIGGVGSVWQLEKNTLRAIEVPQEYQKSSFGQLLWHDGQLWLGTSNGLLYLPPQQQKLVELETPTPLFRYPIDALGEDSDNNLWVGTIIGLFRLQNGQVIEHVENDNQHSFQQVLTIFEDHEKSLWLGSYRDGVGRAWNGRTRRYSLKQGLNEPLVWSLLPKLNGKGLWVGTNRGLSELVDGRFTQVVKAEQLPHPTAYTLMEEPDRLWIGTRKGMAMLQNRKVEEIPHTEQLSALQINSIVRLDEAHLLLGTSNGLYNYSEDALQLVPTEDQSAIFIRPIVRLSDGRIYVGSQKGLFEYKENLLHRVGLDNGLNDQLDVSGILELDKDEIVISTISKGIFFLREGTWHHFTEAEGLPVNESFTVIADEKDHLWVSGFKGLYQVALSHLVEFIDGKRESIMAYMFLSESGGIIGSQKAFCCNGAGNAKGFFKDGILWYPTRDGVVNLNTTNIKLNQTISNVVIERINFNDTWYPVNANQRFKLTQVERDIIFDFTALSFRDPKSVLFQYRLVGYQDDWYALDTNAQRRVNYTNLPPGNYSFQVKASNNAGIWNPEAGELHFTIASYFYETTWFYLLVTSVLAITIGLWHKLRLRNLELKKRELEAEIKKHTEQLEISNSRLHEAVQALKETSQTDQLTGLKNRRYLSNQLPADLAHFERELTAHFQGNSMVFAIADIDHFKNINDTYGHKAGDDVIRKFAQVIRENIREGDYAVRWGGEEFIVVFRPMDASMVPVIIERLRQKIENADFYVSENKRTQITCSIGFAEYPFFRDDVHRLSWEHTVELADHALYTVKQNGRNGWACFRPTVDTPISDDLLFKVKSDLDAELISGRLKLEASYMKTE